MKDFVELRHILTIVVSRLWLLIFVTSVATLTGLLVSRSQTPVYQATTTMLVGQFMQSTSVNRVDIQTSADVAKTYADIALRQPLLDKVVEKLKLDITWRGLKNQVKVKAIEGTQLIEVTAEATSPGTARSIADEVAAQLISISPTTGETTESGINYTFLRQQLESLKERLTEAQTRMSEIDTAMGEALSKTELTRLQEEATALQQSITDWEKNYVSLSNLITQERASNNYLAVIEPAQSTKTPVRPRMVLDTLVAAVVGLLLALGLAFLLDYLDSSIHTPEQLEEVLGLAPLAVIGALPGRRWSKSGRLTSGYSPGPQPVGGAGKDPKRTTRKLITLEQPDSAPSESFRTLRTNIQFASLAKPLRSLVVTSATPMEGKSFVAANLAVAVAQTGKSVVLVDADLRRPSLHRVFGLPNSSGLTNLILSDDLSGTMQRVPDVPNLMVITSGPLPPNPAELLNSERVTQVMTYLAAHAALVIYDTPPAGVVTDSVVLGTRADAVILVARARATRRNLILRAKQALQTVGVDVILPVLNAVASREMSTYRGYYRAYGTKQTETQHLPNDGRQGQIIDDRLLELPLEVSGQRANERKRT